jgi:hypothetical protein
MTDATGVTIFEVAERPWGWLTTSAEVADDTRMLELRNGGQPIQSNGGHC